MSVSFAVFFLVSFLLFLSSLSPREYKRISRSTNGELSLCCYEHRTAISANAFASGGDQNCGNVMTGRNTSRVLQAPGGTQSFTLGEEEEEAYLGSSRLAAQPSFPTVSGRRNEEETSSTIDPSALKSMTLPDLRILCRNNNIQPAGCKETLVERLEEMIARGVSVLAVKTKTTTSSLGPPSSSTKNNTNTGNSTTTLNRVPLSNENNNNNNYVRSNSQNVGNFLTGRNSSRVLAPPGGASSGIF